MILFVSTQIKNAGIAGVFYLAEAAISLGDNWGLLW